MHPVSLILTPSLEGRPLTREPFQIDEMPEVEGSALSEIAHIRLAPWLGPEGIFVVRHKGDLPDHRLVRCVEPDDIDPNTDTIKSSTRWAIATDTEMPEDAVLRHLDKNLHAMSQRGKRTPRWLPPETFSGKLPLPVDAVLIPRIAKRLRPVLLPAGMMPINHNLVVVSGLPADQLIKMLNHPAVQKQAEAQSLRLENGYRSFTATLLRRLIIPTEVLQG